MELTVSIAVAGLAVSVGTFLDQQRKKVAK
jgi:hypothetical protein